MTNTHQPTVYKKDKDTVLFKKTIVTVKMSF